MSSSIFIDSSNNCQASFAAWGINFQTRIKLATQAIAKTVSITQLAKEHKVSRKFIYAQKEKAESALQQAFKPSPPEDDQILFYLPVTKKWLIQVVLALIFICRASYQGVMEFFRDIFDYEISKGGVHNIVYQHITRVKSINKAQDLSKIKESLHDEIYQTGDPVLVGCCARSTYCYLLKLVETCDANTWGFHLLSLKEQQGLMPDFTVIDGGQAARKGQKDAWPKIPARGDIFHALKPFLELVDYLDNRAIDALEKVEDLQHKIKQPRGKWKQKGCYQDLIRECIEAEERCKSLMILTDEIGILYRWLKDDILSLIGPSYIDRQKLFFFLVEELRLREHLYPHKIGPVRRYLENHSDNLLEFVPTMEMCFEEIAGMVQN